MFDREFRSGSGKVFLWRGVTAKDEEDQQQQEGEFLCLTDQIETNVRQMKPHIHIWMKDKDSNH